MSEESGHHKLLKFMLGWKKGAGGHAFKDVEMADEDFKKGFDAGRETVKSVYSEACERYDSKLNFIRANVGV